MTIEQLAARMEYELLAGSPKTRITDLVYDSRKITAGCIFVCIKGTAFDGHSCIPQAVKAHAAAVVIEQEIELPIRLPAEQPDGQQQGSQKESHKESQKELQKELQNESKKEIENEIEKGAQAETAVLKVPDTRLALAQLSAAWFGYPAEQLKTIGITGTKGKTTTTYMVKSILERAGYKAGLIGTIETIIGEKRIPAANTTPESYMIQQYFRNMVDAGCDACVMEVSSQGLMMHRVGGFLFDLGIFTNIEPDHIGPNEHASFEEYLACKGMLFRQCRTGIVNIDDPHTKDVVKGHTCTLETFGFSKEGDLRAKEVRLVQKPGCLGMAFQVSGLCEFEAEINVPGTFSVYNSLAAIAVCRHFQVSKEHMKEALKEAKVKGRIEMIKVSDDFTLMIDYAHNAMSLKSLLTTLREYHPKRLVCLFGCGGGRSRLRRYEMGEVSGNLSDLTIITSDNPRDEDPQAIIDDIKTGIAKTKGSYVEIVDRKEAIRYAISHGKPGDVIVLAGKGHEDYQEVKGVKYPMDERDLIAEILEEGV